MYAAAVILPTLLAISAVTAAPMPAEKRCIGSCGTKIDSSVHTDTSTWSDASTHASQWSNTANSGNSVSKGNNGGGQDFSGMNFGGMKLGCKRAYIEGRDALRQEHQAKLAARGRPHHPHHGGGGRNVHISNKNTRVSNVHNNSAKNSNNRISSVRNTSITKNKSNHVDQSGNMGVIVGSGNVCRREFTELEMERRELDTGASVLAAMGALTERDLGDETEMLATRDLGRMAETLGVRALGHADDDSFTHYKRDVGTECATEECAVMKREVDEILRQHARGLGFQVDDE